MQLLDYLCLARQSRRSGGLTRTLCEMPQRVPSPRRIRSGIIQAWELSTSDLINNAWTCFD
jgi:hypothetical protein